MGCVHMGPGGGGEMGAIWDNPCILRFHLLLIDVGILCCHLVRLTDVGTLGVLLHSFLSFFSSSSKYIARGIHSRVWDNVSNFWDHRGRIVGMKDRLHPVWLLRAPITVIRKEGKITSRFFFPALAADGRNTLYRLEKFKLTTWGPQPGAPCREQTKRYGFAHDNCMHKDRRDKLKAQISLEKEPIWGTYQTEPAWGHKGAYGGTAWPRVPQVRVRESFYFSHFHITFSEKVDFVYKGLLYPRIGFLFSIIYTTALFALRWSF
jgi:hypothetical protein